MKKSLLQEHRELLMEFISKLNNNELPEKHDLSRQVLKKMRIYLKTYDPVEDIFSTIKQSNKSYIKALRTYLEDGPPNILYRDVLRIIKECIKPKFIRLEPYPYSEAVRSFLREKIEEDAEATAEWRAYFEYRLYNPIENYFIQNLRKYQGTLNIALYSFLGERLLPVYRMNVNLSKEKDRSIYDARNKVFESSSPLRNKYSFVWDAVENNITTIFYFDRVEKEKKMIVYEIDADIESGKGSVDARYAGRHIFDTTHRITDIIQSEKNGELPSPVEILNIVNKGRKEEGERKYQYSVIRFLIRSGIFNPRSAAYEMRYGEPGFQDLLQNADPLLHGILRLQYNTSIGRPSAPHDSHSADTNAEEIERKKREQLKARYRKITFFYNIEGENAGKYSDMEDAALDKVIRYIEQNYPEAIDIRIANFETGFFYLTQDKKSRISDIYWLPIPLNWRDRHTGGTIYLNLDKRITDGAKDDEPGRPILPNERVPQKLITTLFFLTGLFADEQIGEIEESLRPAAERAAAVSIMSRNISHNLGSHVLSYLKNLLYDEGQMLRQGVFENILIQDGGEWRVNKRVIEDKGKMTVKQSHLIAPYLRSIGRLLGYFQERQDYIGTLASDWYVYYSPVNFAKEVSQYFSEEIPVLDPDKKSYPTRNLILDYIAFSENYERQDINIYWKWENDKGESYDKPPINLEIALPSGNTGRQGIYTILENFVRNSAKHGKAKSERFSKTLDITMTISDAEKNADYYKIMLTDNSGNAEALIVNRIRKVLDAPLIGPDGTPDEKHKGIKEIQIAAAWLRGIRPFQLKDKYAHDDLPILTVEQVGDNLCYSFYLRKPKPALLIVSDLSHYAVQDDSSGELMFHEPYKHLGGWDVLEYRSKEHTPAVINPKKIPYRFVVVHDSIFEGVEDDESRREIRHLIRERNPVRVIFGVINEELSQEDPSVWLYKKWLNEKSRIHGFNKRQPHFGLVFDKIPGFDISTMPIGIDDEKSANKKIEKDILGTQVIIKDPDKQKDSYDTDILFRIHNDTFARFEEFQKMSRYKDYIFAEGISGGNSTGRLLRDEKIDHYWHLKMLEAALTKILIVDERLWKNLHQNPDKERRIHYERLRKKNIYLLTLELRPSGKMALIDLLSREVAYIDKEGNTEFATEEYRMTYNHFHFISLHQGLLDRVMKYCEDTLGVKDTKALANVLFEKFKQQFWAAFRCVIHSGRSKTPILPQHSGFVQLSSLDTALNDCKLTLCELFYSSIEEY